MHVQSIKTKKNLVAVLIITTALLSAGVCFPALCKSGNSPLSKIRSVSYSQGEKFEKIIIFLDREVSYKAIFLDKNPSKNRPYRLFVDMINTCLPENIKKIYYPLKSNIIKIRVAQRNKKTTRIVLDFKNRIYREHYEISQTSNPPAIVIEIFPKKRTDLKAKNNAEKALPDPSASLSPVAAAIQLEADHAVKKTEQEKHASQNLKKSSDTCIIVIDPGHGGKDPGAIGYRGILEKDVCLDIALELKKLLEKKIKCKTILTRNTDKFVSLAERATIANSSNADFFLSIHANSHDDVTLTGIETYYLNFSSDASARRVAARENFTTPSKISDLELILFDLMQSDKINKSSILAGYVHNALIENITKRYKTLRNLGVKHAPMRVLIDAEMPCVLIETAFISNPSEAKRLKSSTYQKLIASGILKGIRNFAKEQKTAFNKLTD